MDPSSSSEEKGSFAEVAAVLRDDPDAEYGGSNERERLERKLVKKLDFRLSALMVIYILNYIDRNNAPAAGLRGFENDLHLKDQEYNTFLSIFYVGYILMQVPSNMLLNYWARPSIYLPVCMMVWGVISILTGVSKNFVGALMTRFFLGIVEAAFFPGALFILSKWYTRKELGLRMSLLISSNLISNAFGSLLASGILDGMQGKLGLPAWRWLFYIEGGVTVAVAFAIIFVLPDFPMTTRWLTPLERSLALRRMAEDGAINVDDQAETGAIHDNTDAVPDTELGATRARRKLLGNAHGLWLAVTDWKVWWLGIALCFEVAALSFNQFFPTLVATLGFGRTMTLVLVAPPWFFSAFSSYFNGIHSDKYGERFYHIIASLLVGIIGFIIGSLTMNVVARYISLFMIALSYCGYMIVFSWASGSIPRPPAKRAVAIGLISCLSQVGNVAGSYFFPTMWGPSYRKSYGICIALQGMTIIMCCIFRAHLKALNRRLEEAERTRGELTKGFRYLL